MKKLLFLFFLLSELSHTFAQENFDVSTLRIGPFTLKMKDKAVEKISNTKLQFLPTENEYTKNNKINYLGENVEITINQSYDDQGKTDGSYQIYSLSTKSKKFRTKSGMGVGSTKDQLFEAYKNYPNF